MNHARMFGAAALVSLFALAAPAIADTAPPSASPAPAAQASPAAPATAAAVTDVELRSFAAARAEIEPINARPRTTDAEREAAIAAMRASLERHNLTGARYNEIVAAVQADPALAQRLAALTPQPARPAG